MFISIIKNETENTNETISTNDSTLSNITAQIVFETEYYSKTLTSEYILNPYVLSEEFLEIKLIKKIKLSERLLNLFNVRGKITN